ncbi:hypothetical protein F5Y15DRAFT_79453 [Xylariaceae sp. FL0016]|nr:hypothetical protein F5Y15DRAFT_79453 [Xylariaceae sp. FL0016]
MSSLHTGAATLPKGFRYNLESGPKTPEPDATVDDAHLPPAPRQRLRLKKRHVSQRHAPTQHFLASVAAADVPIPSVENYETGSADQEMSDTLPELHVQDFDELDIYQHIWPRPFSPPKTPALELAPPRAPAKYPDWSIDSEWSESDLESSPEYESSRPSTAFSTQTSSSLFSQYSHALDDVSCISPDLDSTEFPKVDMEDTTNGTQKRPRRAPWTKAMSSHLWATYLLYLSDPRVTPIRLGKSCIPPNGVCSRVARQAQRSWKGSKAQSTADPKSGSSTPTAEPARAFMQWPHTGAATRAHLRELCKLKATNKPDRYLSRSPTPFNKTAHRRWNRRSTPARSPSVFSGHDMAMSLALSTSDSMQPHGPLSRLASAREETEPFPELAPEPEEVFDFIEKPSVVTPTRLGSPFLAKSYGPSSSSTITENINLPRQPNTVGPRKLLKSPVRLTRSRSGTQKRRSVKALEDAPRKRPSLSSAFWRESSRSNSLPSLEQRLEANAGTRDDPFISSSLPQTYAAPNFVQTRDGSKPFVISTSSLANSGQPARLGSPFSGGISSHSFPNRLSAPVSFNLTALRRPFATVQQPSQASSEAPTVSTRSSLASRLAYLDQRLKELRNRGGERRRSHSPL